MAYTAATLCPFKPPVIAFTGNTILPLRVGALDISVAAAAVVDSPSPSLLLIMRTLLVDNGHLWRWNCNCNDAEDDGMVMGDDDDDDNGRTKADASCQHITCERRIDLMAMLFMLIIVRV